jgi:hypothetical protein
VSTWATIINQAFQDLGVIQPGESITSTMQTDAFVYLNQLLSSLSTEGATAFNQVMQTFALVAGDSEYTFGSGGQWATTGALRPQKVTAWRAYAGDMHRGGLPMAMEAFSAAIQAKQAELLALNTQAIAEGVITTFPASVTAPIPAILGADTAYPLINVRVYPPPSAAPGSVELAYWTPIVAAAAVGDTVTMPPGYEAMIHFNLAVALAPQYARSGGITPELAANAQNAKAAIVQQNTGMAQPPETK